jgi:hypothetical protein
MTHLSYQSTILNRQIGKQYDKQSSEAVFTFDSLIRQYPNIPESTAILGKSGEIPILFDLDDPRPGSVLVVNDHLPAIRKFLTAVMRSLVSFSHPTNFQFITISHYPDKWLDLIQEFDPEFAYCAGISGDYETSTEDWIQFLSQKAEERSSGRNFGPAVILFIDDYDLIQNLDLHVRIHFDWLLKHGATSRIWIMSGLDLKKNPDGVNQINQFKTRIFGQMEPKISANLDDFVPKSELVKLTSDLNFVTKIATNWIRFSAPKLQSK